MRYVEQLGYFFYCCFVSNLISQQIRAKSNVVFRITKVEAFLVIMVSIAEQRRVFSEGHQFDMV